MSRKKISVLILSYYMYCPPISGGVKRMLAPVLNMDREAGIEFSIMYVVHTSKDLQQCDDYFSQLPQIDFFHGTLTNGTFQYDYEFNPDNFPKQIWFTLNKNFLDSVLKEVSKKNYDIIQVENTQLSWVVPKLRLVTEAKIILDCQNLEWLIYERWLPYAKPADCDMVNESHRQLMNWEKTVYGWYDDIFCISPVEKKIVENIASDVNVHYVPSGAGVNDDEYIPKNIDKKPYDLIFVGSMAWFPTTDALTWLLTDVMPIVWKKRPKTKLEVIGSDKPDKDIAKLLYLNKRITFWGAVHNEVPFLHKSKIFVSPIRIGAGVRLKNPTAWVAHLPLVATSLSVEGLECSDGFDVLIGDTPEIFAAHILNLLDNPVLRESLAKNAYETYEKKYSTKRLMEIWKEAYYSVMDKNPQGRKTR